MSRRLLFGSSNPGAPATPLLFRAEIGTPGLLVSDGTNYNAYPAICVAANGHLVRGIFRGTGNADLSGTLFASRCASGDDPADSANWSTDVSIQHPSSGPGGLTTLSSGTLIMVGGQPATGFDTLATTQRSTDHGASWSSPVVIEADFAVGNTGQRINGPVVEVPTGLLAVVYGDDGSGTKEYVRLVLSTDAALTWTDVGVVAQDATFHFQEPALTLRHQAGVPVELVVGIRTIDPSGNRSFYITRTSDLTGATGWSTPELGFADYASPGLMFETPDGGDMFVIGRPGNLRGGTPDPGDVDRPGAIVLMSPDGGRNWSPASTITPIPPNAATSSRYHYFTMEYAQSAYPGVLGDDGSLIALVGYQHFEDQDIADVWCHKFSKVPGALPGLTPFPRAALAMLPNVVSHWPLGDSGLTAADVLDRNPGAHSSSGVSQGPLLGLPGDTVSRGSVYDGADGFTDLGTANALDPGGNSWTLSMLVSHAVSATEQVFAYRPDGSFELEVTAGNHLALTVAGVTITDAGSMIVDKLYHVAVVADLFADNCSLYKNGVLIDTIAGYNAASTRANRHSYLSLPSAGARWEGALAHVTWGLAPASADVIAALADVAGLA